MLDLFIGEEIVWVEVEDVDVFVRGGEVGGELFRGAGDLREHVFDHEFLDANGSVGVLDEGELFLVGLPDDQGLFVSG